VTDIAVHQSERDALDAILRSEGLDDHGASPHSWRCEYPDRYPNACHCVEWVREAILQGNFRYVPDVPLAIESGEEEIPPPPPIVPRTVMLDVWLALGLDGTEFNEWYSSKPEVDAWRELLNGIRQAVRDA
jgi:hypothetical protein